MTATEELQSAIQEHALKRTKDGYRIVGKGSQAAVPQLWIFDFHAVMLQARLLNAYAEIFWEKYGDRLPFQVGGLETSAIPLVAAIVMKGAERGIPVNGFFIRKSRDREGLLKQIEGTLTSDPIILVDDVMNSGGSFLKQIEILREDGKDVSDICAILAYRALDAYQFATERNIRVQWLYTLEDFGLPLMSASIAPAPNSAFDVVWKFSADSPSFEHVLQKSAPILDETHVYFGSDAGTFYALDQATGAIAWTFAIGKHPIGKGIFSSPTIAGDAIYFGGYDGVVYALHCSDGHLLWKYTDAEWVGSSPAIAPELNLVYIGLEFGLFRKRGGIVALDCKTGEEKWRAIHPEMTHASPLYIKEENLVVIGSNDGTIYAYNAKSGERVWWYQTGADIKTCPAYDPKRRLVLVPSMDSKIYALSARDGSPQWAFLTGAGLYSIPLVHDDVVYVASLDKSLYAVDLGTGRKQWEFETSGRIFSSPVIAESSVWIGSNDGRLYEIDPTRGTVQCSHQFTERIVNAIAYHSTTRRFFVPTVANDVYCLEQKKGA